MPKRELSPEQAWNVGQNDTKIQCLSRIRKMLRPAFLSRRYAPITRGKPALNL